MLPADQLELLTAAVDGELTARQSRRLRRLLASSAEARAALAKLQDDSGRLRRLPKLAPPADLPERVMAQVATATPPTLPCPADRPTAVPFRARRREWVPVAVAASLLLAVSFGSFLFFTRPIGGPSGTVVQGTGTLPKPKPVVARHDAIPPPRERSQPAPAVGERPQPPVVARADATPDTAPEPRPKLGPPAPKGMGLVASPLLPDPPSFDRVQVRLPFLAAAADLDRDDVRATLAEELGRDPVCQVNLFVKDPARATELLQAAARSAGLAVHTDAAAADRVKTRKPTPAFVLFTESLTPAEVRNLLTRFAADDAKANARVFETIHVTPLHPADQRDLHLNVLGFDVNPAKKAGGGEPRPISSGTADQVAKSVGGRGEKAGVLTTYLPSSVRVPPVMSKELGHYVTRRGDRKPNTVAVVIVVRHAGN